ncbi:M15 family metallopeptidase [Ectobacillus ponti]|uniref:M15 family metallopeptidase n=1 Tax=Ectobacillus ponti TaxID=2961894 RepID=A0AA41X2E7_9BACI|nr:M15 family metallopeptidase [Ectobacillus ponti]MCP8967367.1 M15 family metallopeptidase [Ectobacillus ponti]
MKKRLFLIALCSITMTLTASFLYYKNNLSSEHPVKAAAIAGQQDSTGHKHPEEAAPAFPVVSSPVITNPESLLVLVNKQRTLSADYTPKTLIRPNVEFSFGKKKADQALMRPETAASLEKMFAAAKQDGFELLAVSGYRSYNHQQSLFNTYINEYGKDKAEQFSAPPGASEHQTGLAVDITARSAKFQLDLCFAETPEGKWVAAHAHEYGFIVRYQKGKTGITGYQYEPWHIRYVGNPYATYLYNNKLTLEEVMYAKAEQ